MKAIIVFVDFKKAFDSVHRGKMMRILKAYDVPPNLLSAIIKTYENTRAKVITPDGETDFFEIIAGVLQGDTLAPYLFAIVLDYALRKAINGKEEALGFQLHRRRSRRTPAIVVTDLDFADDIALISEEISAAQEMLTRVEAEANKVGLHLNAKKTEAQQFNLNEPLQLKTTDDITINVVDNFKYLGSYSHSSEKDLSVRKALAWSACHKLKMIWSSKLTRELKVRLFVATVESVLLFGAETWTLTKSMKKQLDGCYTRLLRMAVNVTWKDHISNEDLYMELPRVSDKVAQRRLRLAGHCIRHKEEVASDLVIWEPTEGQANRGRRHKSYIDNLLEDTGIHNAAELRTAMMDRNNWKVRVEAAGRPDSRRR